MAGRWGGGYYQIWCEGVGGSNPPPPSRFLWTIGILVGALAWDLSNVEPTIGLGVERMEGPTPMGNMLGNKVHEGEMYMLTQYFWQQLSTGGGTITRGYGHKMQIKWYSLP